MYRRQKKSFKKCIDILTVPDIDPQDELCTTEKNTMDHFNPLVGPSESTIFKILSTQGAQKIRNFNFFGGFSGNFKG